MATTNIEDTKFELQERYYEDLYPQEGDYVIVKVKEVTETGAYVYLLEYNNIEGMIPINEFTNRRFKSFNKIIREGRVEVALVLAVDKDKGYIDLSKARVSTEDVTKCQQKWSRAKSVQTAMIHMSIFLSLPLLEIHKQITWPLYKKYGSAYEAFLMYAQDENSVSEIDAFHEELGKTIKKKLQPSSFKYNAEIDVTCLNYRGIEAVKESLDCASEIYPISITLIRPPSFLISITVSDKEQGITILNEACDVICKKIRELGGSMTVKVQPYLV